MRKLFTERHIKKDHPCSTLPQPLPSWVGEHQPLETYSMARPLPFPEDEDLYETYALYSTAPPLPSNPCPRRNHTTGNGSGTLSHVHIAKLAYVFTHTYMHTHTTCARAHTHTTHAHIYPDHMFTMVYSIKCIQHIYSSATAISALPDKKYSTSTSTTFRYYALSLSHIYTYKPIRTMSNTCTVPH